MTKRFRWTSGVLAGLGVSGLIAIAALSLYGVQKDVDIYTGEPAFTAWLFNWPIGFRTLIVATLAALLTALGSAAIGALDRAAAQSGWRLWINFVARLLLAAGICGVLDMLGLFGNALVNYGAGRWNLVWFFGIPLLLSLLLRPRWSGLLLIFLMTPLGLLAFAGLCWLTKLDPV